MKRIAIKIPKFFRNLSRTGLVVVIAAIVALTAGGGMVVANLLGGSSKQASATDIDLSKGLVGQWKMDGNFKDATPYGNNGTITGGVTTGTDRKGRASSAYVFDGASGATYVTIPKNSGFMATDNTPFSLSIWLYPTDLSNLAAQRSVLSNENYLTNGFRFGFSNTDAKIYFWSAQSGGTLTVRNETAFQINTWYHVVVTYDGTTGKVYVNGSPGTSGTGTVLANTNPLKLTKVGGSPSFIGTMDDFRIYNRVLSADEVSALYKTYDSNIQTNSGEKGLVGQWKMDGNAKDDTPNANNGTVNGAALTTDRKGTANSAYSFDGSSTSISVPDNQILSSNYMSVSAWVKETSVSGGGSIYNRRNLSNIGGVSMEPESGGSMSCYFYIGGAWRWTTSASAIPVGQWTHYVCTYDGTNVQIYVNGALSASTPFSGTIGNPSSSQVMIGKNVQAPLYWNGSIDDVRVYNRALSATEIAAQYKNYNSQISVGGGNNGTVNLMKGLIGEWDMNGNTKDATPFSHNGGIYGSPTYGTDRKGRANSTLDFTLGSQRVDLTSTSWPSTAITVSVWMKQSSLFDYNDMVANSWMSDGGWLIYSYSGAGGVAYFGVSQSGGQYSAGGCIVTLNTWHHMVGTYDGSTVRFYLDGAACGGTRALSNEPLVTSATVTLNQDGGDSIARSLDDVRVYNRAISAAEVTALYQEYK